MSEDWKSDWRTDRYSVVITNPSTTQPAAIIFHLKKDPGKRGAMKHADQLKHPVSMPGRTKEEKEEFAKMIGMIIIEDSPILKKWFKNQEER